MSMWIWFGLAGVSLILEALSGTFYLLLVALGLFAAGLVAIFEPSLWLQLASFTVVSILGLLILNQKGIIRKKGSRSATSDADANLDIGMTVTVREWLSNNQAEVIYRGVNWQAVLSPKVSGEPQPGQYVIVDVQGVSLVLEPKYGNEAILNRH